MINLDITPTDACKMIAELGVCPESSDTPYFIYKDRHFRSLVWTMPDGVIVDCLDICDGYFDRWANSHGASITPHPRNSTEFKKAVNYLLSIKSILHDRNGRS